MPLRVYLDAKRSPNYRIRGTVCGVRVEQSSGVAGKRDAEKIAERLTAEIRKGHIAGAPTAEKAELSFAEALETYLLEPGHSVRTRKLLTPLAQHFGLMPGSSIDQRAVDAYVQARYPQQNAATVLRDVITPLRAILRHAGIETRFRQPKQREGRLRFLTEDEADRLVEACAEHLRPLVLFLLHTGARLGEALQLQWSEVNLVTRRLTFTDTKNGSTRGLPINDVAFAALANLDYRTGISNPDGTWHRTAARTGHVFRTPLGQPYPVSETGGGQIKTAWRGACRRAGITGATPHTLRHTFASWLVQRGVHITAVGDLLGHKSPAMTARYAHLGPDHLVAAVQTLGQEPGRGVKTEEKLNKIKA